MIYLTESQANLLRDMFDGCPFDETDAIVAKLSEPLVPMLALDVNEREFAAIMEVFEQLIVESEPESDVQALEIALIGKTSITDELGAA